MELLEQTTNLQEIQGTKNGMLSAKSKTIGDSRQIILFLQQNPCKKEGGGAVEVEGEEEKGKKREIYQLKTYEPITTFELIWIMIQTT